MKILLLILLLSANPFQRTVSWNAVADADTYRVYWATGPGLKCSTWNTSLFSSYAGQSPSWSVQQSFDAPSCPDPRCSLTFADPAPGAQIIYFVVTAENEAGESALNHPVVP